MSERVPDAQANSAEDVPLSAVGEFSGSKLVIGMFAFAMMMAGSVWVYSYFHSRPFQPLQVAIAQAFPKSVPQVQGGQRKIHRETPKILRVTLRVKFDPQPESAQPQVNDVVAQLAELARRHTDFASYEELEVHLVQMRPERAAQTKVVTRKIAEFSPL